jgi:hypothetical protein
MDCIWMAMDNKKCIQNSNEDDGRAVLKWILRKEM